jgi:hypothetical protein
MTGRLIIICLPIVILAIFPSVAYADAGTPLLWAGAFHLFIGNAVIGIAEGLLLDLLFRPKRTNCVVLMVTANYFSAWVGGVLIVSMIMDSLSLDLYNAWPWLWCMVALSYFITLLLEWPFVALCLRKTDRWFPKSIWGSLIVQSASYLVLFGWYWAVSGTSLFTDLDIVQPTAISFPKDTMMLYYIDEDNDDVYAWELGMGELKTICRLKPLEKTDWLCLRESRTASGRWDLVATSDTSYPPGDPSRVVLADLTCDVAEPLIGLKLGGDVPRFRTVDKSGWQFTFGWMSGSLYGENAEERKHLYASLDTPFLKWPVYYPTQLPTGQVIFQLGKNQICILDPNKRNIALLAKGRWPVITIRREEK